MSSGESNVSSSESLTHSSPPNEATHQKPCSPWWTEIRLGEVLVLLGIICGMLLLSHAETLYAGQGIWLAWESDPGYFCERDRPTQFLREPQNGWSAFSFLAAGWWLWLCAYRDAREPKLEPSCSSLTAMPLLSVIGGSACVAYAIGTGFNHACRCHTGHMIDVCAMYATTYFVTLVNMFRFVRVITVGAAHLKYAGNDNIAFFSTSSVAWLESRKIRWQILYVTAYVFGLAWFYNLSTLYYSDPRTRDREAFIMVGLIGTALGFDGVCRALGVFVYNTKLVFVGMVFGMVAFLSHVLDSEKIACVPNSVFQLYAVRQVCASITFLCVYQSLRTEKLIGLYIAPTRPKTE